MITILFESWTLCGVTTNLILSMAMITTEKEAKKTKVDCVVLVILQRISFIIITIENGYHTKS